MPTGLGVPVGVDASGGARLVSGDENDNKIIQLALSSDSNENAFQQNIGLGQDMIFDLNDAGVRARILRRVILIFKAFQIQNRYKLLKNTVKWTEDGQNQALILEFKYVNLESDEEVFFRRAFTSGD